MTDDTDQFDLRLRGHFARELDGQLGRAPAAFARSSRRRPWRAAIIGGVLAAAAAIAVVVWMGRAPAAGPTNPTVADAPQPIEYQASWETIDQGTVFIADNIPMRQFLHRRVDTVQWTDPKTNATIEITAPHEEIVLVAVQTY